MIIEQKGFPGRVGIILTGLYNKAYTGGKDAPGSG